MSLITRDVRALGEYVANKLIAGETVYIYRREQYVGTAWGYIQYIATSEDSDTPPGSVLDRIETPERSSIYDNAVHNTLPFNMEPFTSPFDRKDFDL